MWETGTNWEVLDSIGRDFNIWQEELTLYEVKSNKTYLIIR